MVYTISESTLAVKQRFQGGQQGAGDDLGPFGGRVDAVRLNRPRNGYQVLVDHGDERYVVLRRQRAEDLAEGANVVGPVVGRQRDPRQQHLDVCGRERPENLVEIVLALGERQAAQSVVAAELDNHHLRMKAKDGGQQSNRVFSRSSAGALVNYFIMIILGIKLALERIGKRLPRRKPVARRNAVAEAS